MKDFNYTPTDNANHGGATCRQRLNLINGGFRGRAEGATASLFFSNRGGSHQICDRLSPPLNQPPPFENPGSATGLNVLERDNLL